MYWGDIGKGLFDTLLVGCLLGITGFFALASGMGGILKIEKVQ